MTSDLHAPIAGPESAAPVRSDIVGGHPEPMSVALSRFIHLARWVAALAVLLHHVSATFVSVPDIMSAPHNPLVYVWWFFTPYVFAHQAVVVFFVLSGFLVGGAVLKKRKRDQPWLRDYVLDRITRIYIVLLPVIALTLALDGTGRAWFGDAHLYDLDFFRDSFGLGLILPNLLSLQGIWFAPLGTNLPLWSLGMEVWFYLLFPALLLPLLRAYPKHWKRVFGLAAALLFLFAVPAGNYLIFGFVIWIIGALVRIIPRPLIRSRWLSLALFILATVVIRLAVREHLLKQEAIKYLVDGAHALLFANLLLTLRFDTSGGFRFARSDWHARAASFSYTLYAFHVPAVFWIGGLIGTWLGAGWRLEPATPAHYALAAGTILFCVLLGWTLAQLTEAHTETVRHWARDLFNRQAPPTPA